MTIAIVYIHTCRRIHTSMHMRMQPHTHTLSVENTLRHINAHSFEALYQNSHGYDVTWLVEFAGHDSQRSR